MCGWQQSLWRPVVSIHFLSRGERGGDRQPNCHKFLSRLRLTLCDSVCLNIKFDTHCENVFIKLFFSLKPVLGLHLALSLWICVSVPLRHYVALSLASGFCLDNEDIDSMAALAPTVPQTMTTPLVRSGSWILSHSRYQWHVNVNLCSTCRLCVVYSG